MVSPCFNAYYVTLWNSNWFFGKYCEQLRLANPNSSVVSLKNVLLLFLFKTYISYNMSNMNKQWRKYIWAHVKSLSLSTEELWLRPIELGLGEGFQAIKCGFWLGLSCSTFVTNLPLASRMGHNQWQSTCLACKKSEVQLLISQVVWHLPKTCKPYTSWSR